MRKKFDFKIIIIIVLVVVFIGIVFTYNNMRNNIIISSEIEKIISTNQTSNNSSKISSSSEIESGLTEKLELHATYYYSEIYVEENRQIKKGENILEYTNGEYLLAPYDCVIIGSSLPEVNGKCTGEHYIEVAAINILEVSFSVSETEVDKLAVGQEAMIEVEAIGKSFQGYITNISSTANNGNFTAKVEFENDGNIKLGMTASIEIELE